MAVGDSLGGAVALELQKHHPDLKVRPYGAPIVDLKGAVQPTLYDNTERYRNKWGPISILDRSAHATKYTNELLNQSTVTHQYQHTKKIFKPE